MNLDVVRTRLLKVRQDRNTFECVFVKADPTRSTAVFAMCQPHVSQTIVRWLKCSSDR